MQWDPSQKIRTFIPEYSQSPVTMESVEPGEFDTDTDPDECDVAGDALMDTESEGEEIDGPIADLHVHTTVSDGTLETDEVPEAARKAGLSCVAITDHDRLNPGVAEPVVEVGGIMLVRGIELRVEAAPPSDDAEPLRVDLLGLGVVPTDQLVAELDRIQENRIERGRQIVRNVEAELGVDLDVTLETGVGRPHIARAIDDSEAPLDYEAAFDQLIGDDGPCFVPRDIPSFERGVELLDSAARIVGLAHPLRYENLEFALSLASELDAIERWYPYGNAVDPSGSGAAAVADACKRHDLLGIGGSDAHGTELGEMGVDATAFTPVRKRLRND